MTKFLISLLVLIVVAVVVVLALASAKPDTYNLQTSVVINAKPEKVFAMINDLNNWTKWSPWEAMDPEMKRAVTGSTKGVGQVYEWDGKKVGKGRITITGSTPSTKVVMKNEWLAPMQMYNMNPP